MRVFTRIKYLFEYQINPMLEVIILLVLIVVILPIYLFIPYPFCITRMP